MELAFFMAAWWRWCWLLLYCKLLKYFLLVTHKIFFTRNTLFTFWWLCSLCALLLALIFTQSLYCLELIVGAVSAAHRTTSFSVNCFVVQRQQGVFVRGLGRFYLCTREGNGERDFWFQGRHKRVPWEELRGAALSKSSMPGKGTESVGQWVGLEIGRLQPPSLKSNGADCGFRGALWSWRDGQTTSEWVELLKLIARSLKCLFGTRTPSGSLLQSSQSYLFFKSCTSQVQGIGWSCVNSRGALEVLFALEMGEKMKEKAVWVSIYHLAIWRRRWEGGAWQLGTIHGQWKIIVLHALEERASLLLTL